MTMKIEAASKDPPVEKSIHIKPVQKLGVPTFWEVHATGWREWQFWEMLQVEGGNKISYNVEDLAGLLSRSSITQMSF